ncbi:MAG: hypothetical protein HZA89_04855 [Verrucomicrobia bacterium]|nr:hypothetical protein [Verrucomicrobiota bacterium]
MKPRFAAAVSLLVFASTALSAAELKPLISRPGRLLLSEDFSGGALAKPWETGGRRGAFTVVDGALQGVCSPDDSHGPSVGVPIEGRNVVIAFSMKYVKPANFLFLLDGESQFGGAAHLLRVAMSSNLVTVQQDRGSPASKLAQKAEKDQAAREKKKVSPPSPEQLADPKFYRTERLASQKHAIGDGQWHRVLVEAIGNEVVVQVDNAEPIRTKATVLEAKKSRVVFLVGGAATALIDNVKVWEAKPKK